MRTDPPDKREGMPDGGLKKESDPAQSARNSMAKDPKKLSPEEQMAAYEEDLKESDWGHQPC